jgi:hypothetical protein
MAEDMESFAPSGARAAGFDGLMRSRLADSLDHIVERSRGLIAFDEPALARLIAGLRSGTRVSPDVFAIYYDLVESLLEGREDAGEALMAEIAAIGRPGGDLAIVPFARSELGARTFDRYRRMMDTDPAAPYRFEEPPAEAATAYAAGIRAALDLMARADGELAGEFRSLVSQVLLATGESADGLSEFDGGSSFMLWGALFINPGRPKTDVELVETLAHESAHSLLFGFAIDDPLVENPDSERFKSPLRDDPRPMDGIYHATFVSARMHYAMAKLAGSGLLSGGKQAAAEEAMARDRRAFLDGLETVEAHGRLTAKGAAIMAGARNYMADAA